MHSLWVFRAIVQLNSTPLMTHTDRPGETGCFLNKGWDTHREKDILVSEKPPTDGGQLQEQPVEYLEYCQFSVKTLSETQKSSVQSELQEMLQRTGWNNSTNVWFVRDDHFRTDPPPNVVLKTCVRPSDRRDIWELLKLSALKNSKCSFSTSSASVRGSEQGEKSSCRDRGSCRCLFPTELLDSNGMSPAAASAHRWPTAGARNSDGCSQSPELQQLEQDEEGDLLHSCDSGPKHC